MKKLKFLFIVMGLSLLTVSCETEQVTTAPASEQTVANTPSQKLATGTFKLVKNTFFTPRGTTVSVLFAAGSTVEIEPDGKLASGKLAKPTVLFSGASGNVLYAASYVLFNTNGIVAKGVLAVDTPISLGGGKFFTFRAGRLINLFEDGSFFK